MTTPSNSYPKKPSWSTVS